MKSHKLDKIKKDTKDAFGLLYLISKVKPEFKFKIKLQKLVLIAKKDQEINYPFSFEFVPYYYGPYSYELQKFLEVLILKNFVEQKVEEIPQNNENLKIFKYTLSSRGEEFLIDKIKEEGFKELADKIDKLWEKCKNWSTPLIIKYAKEISGMESINK